MQFIKTFYWYIFYLIEIIFIILAFRIRFPGIKKLESLIPQPNGKPLLANNSGLTLGCGMGSSFY